MAISRKHPEELDRQFQTVALGPASLSILPKGLQDA